MTGAPDSAQDDDAPRPAVDVVILTYNDGELLDAAVRSALDSEGLHVRVWVIDNGSEPPATTCDDPRVHLVRNEHNAGVGGGRNQGVRLGSAPIVCLLDSDARLGPAALAGLVEPLEKREVALTVPVFVDQHPTESAGLAPTFWLKLQRAAGRTNRYRPAPCTGADRTWDVDFGIGACQVFRRSVFDDVGGIDDSDPFGPEDVDFCLRVRATGARILQVADAEVHHPPRRAHRRLLTRKGIRHVRSILRHFLRHGLRGRRDRNPGSAEHYTRLGR